MRLSIFTTLFTTSCLFATCNAAWVLKESYTSNNFFWKWDFDTFNDPSNGVVNYVNKSVALSNGLIYTRRNGVRIQTDMTSIVPASVRGRDSVRLKSKSVYNNGLFIFDVNHMPTGCGTWPAIWSFGPNWPTSGEIDIVEGVNVANNNLQSLHTGKFCNMTTVARNQTGWIMSNDCDLTTGGAVGCGVMSPSNTTFGKEFNNNVGGIYIMLWEDSGIKFWFFSRKAIPADIVAGKPDVGKWGVPTAQFPFGANCPKDNFVNNNIIINLTFCGDWAGGTFSTDCPGITQTCGEYVRNNPAAFTEAYWDLQYIKVFQNA